MTDTAQSIAELDANRSVPPPEIWAPRLRRIVRQQRELYRHLDRLSLAQSDLIRQGSTDDLLGVLGERQLLIDELTQLNEEIAPFVERWDQLAPTLMPAQRAELRELFDDVRTLVEAISTRDEGDRDLLESQRAGMSRELGGMANARSAVQAYADRPKVVEPRFQDREG